MPSRKFWKEVVRSVFDLNDKNRLRKAKVCKRAVQLARTVLPDVSKKDLWKEIESYLVVSISNGTIKAKGEKLSPNNKERESGKKRSTDQAPAGSNSSDKEIPSKKRKLTDGQRSHKIAMGQDARRQGVKRKEMGDEEEEPESKSQSDERSPPAGEEMADSDDSFAEKRKRKKQQQTSSAAAPKEKMPRIESEETPSAKHGKWTKAELSALEDAAGQYARQHNLSDMNFSWLIHTPSAAHKEAWEAIGSAVPHRTARSVRLCATRALVGALEEAHEARKAGRQGQHAREDYTKWRQSLRRKDVKAGRFTSAEKEILRQAIVALAEEKGCSTTDFSWLLNKDLGDKRTRDWIKIASALPHRTALSVWHCGIRILHPDRLKGKFSEEEDKMLVRMVESHGKAWKLIGQEIGRTPSACRDRHRILASSTPKRIHGVWSADECRKLVDAVQEYLRAKQAVEEVARTATLSVEDVPSPGGAREEQPDRRVILDDINWDVVAEKVITRNRQQCMNKWYRGLAPSMVTTGEWGSGDDRRLLKGLLRSGARQVFDVDWGVVVEGRTEKQTRRRWQLMTRHVPDANDLEFDEHLEFLARKFTPDLWARYRGAKNSTDEEEREQYEEGEGTAEQEDRVTVR